MSTSWFGSFGEAVADFAVNIKDKTISAISGEVEDIKKVDNQQELTQDEQFVQDLYRRVHTQSRLLQNQMTLNIIHSIKERSRIEDDPSELAVKCGKWRKNIVPLKWVSLTLLAVIPMFQIPNWCVREKKYHSGVDS